MLKNAYFLEKDVKYRFSVGCSAPEPPLASGGWGIRPQTPALLLPPTITTLSSSFLALNVYYYLIITTYFKIITFKKEQIFYLQNFCGYFSLQTL